MAAQEAIASSQVTTEKLVHPLAEVRRRAVQSLDFKLKHRLLGLEDLAKDRTVLKCLLGCLQYDDNGALTDSVVLMLLAKVASLSGAARQILHLGGEQLLGQLQRDRPAELQPAIEHARAAILAGASLTSEPMPSSHHRHDHVRAAPPYVGVTQLSSAASSPATATLLPRTGPPPAFTYSPTRSAAHAPRSEAAGGPGSYASMETPASWTIGPASNPATRNAVERRRQLAEHHEARSASILSSSPRDWLLQPVALGQADDQELFEMSLRLKYVDNPGVVLPALVQLHGTSLVDVPVEAIVSRHDIVNHLLALISSSSTPLELVALAAKSLLRVVVLLKRALLLATDPTYVSPSTGSTGVAKSEAGDAGAAASPSRSPRGGSPLGDQGLPTQSEGFEQLSTAAQNLLPQPLPHSKGTDAEGSFCPGASAGAEDGPVNVTLAAYVISLKVFYALRDPQRLFHLAPLAEELVPLLLLGRDRVLVATGGEPDRLKWAQLLQVLSQALVANLAMARSESPPIVQAFVRDGAAGPVPPVLNAPSAAILALAARLLAALPRELWLPDVIPPALVDTLAAVTRDDVLAALLPGVRAAALPLLAALRPDVGAVLEVAATGQVALAAGEVLVRQVSLLRLGELAPEAWLQQLQQALPALHLPDQEALLEGVMQGLAVICGLRTGPASGADAGAPGGVQLLATGGGPLAPSRRLAWTSTGVGEGAEPAGAIGESAGGLDSRGTAAAGCSGAGHARGAHPTAQWVQQAEGVFLALLSHASAAVALTCFGLLEGLVQEARTQPGHPLPQLLARKAVLEHLVVLGLSDERTRRQVARILLGIMPDPAIQACILPWSSWIRLYEGDPQVGALAAALVASVQPTSPASPTGIASSWRRLGPVMAELYGTDVERRRAAARQLAGALQAMGNPLAAEEPFTGDPFRVCLDGGARDDLVVPTANPRLASSFRPMDVTNLLAIFANGELALELRRSAAEQMLALAAEERLREVLTEEVNLRLITSVAALRDPSTGTALSASQAGVLAGQGLPPPAPDLLSTLDVQLPIAAVNLLFVLAAHSPRVRSWLRSEARAPGGDAAESGAPTAAAAAGSGDDGGGGGLGMLVSGVMPLVFHSMVTVRRAVARLFAALCFGSEADRWSGWAGLARGAAGQKAAAVSQAAREGPARVGPMARAPGAAAGTASAGDVLVLPHAFQRGYVFPCRVAWVGLPPVCRHDPEPGVLEGKPRLQDLVSEQQQLAVLLIQERMALRVAGGDPAQLLALMNERPDCLGGLSSAALHTLAASIRAVSPAGLVGRCLAAVSTATSHPECTAALRGLQLVCSTRQGICTLAAADWQGHLENLLATSPVSAEDRALWVELLEPVRRLVASGAMAQAQLLQLASYLQQSTHRVLSAPDASADPPTIPVALAGAAMPGFSAPPLHAHLVCSQTVMATLVEVVRCARTRLPVQQALRVLLALSPTQLLHTLSAAHIGNGAANYGCRALAVQLLLEVTALLAAALEVDRVTVSSLEPGLEQALLVCLKALLGSVSGGFTARALQPPTPGNAALFAAAAPERPRNAQGSSGGGGGGGFAGKGAVRLAMHCLLHLTALLPVEEWTAAWRQLSGSFWMSRLLRDRDAVLRSLAAEVLARLMQPGADATQAMVAQGWPDAVKMMAKLAIDRRSCFALRTAALRVLSCCMTQETLQQQVPGQQASPTGGPQEAAPFPRRQLFASITALPPAATVLQHGPLWEQLPYMLRVPGAPAPFLAAALSLLLQGLLLDGERKVEVLRQPGMLDRLLQFLDAWEAPGRTAGSHQGQDRTGAVAAAPATAAAAAARLLWYEAPGASSGAAASPARTGTGAGTDAPEGHHHGKASAQGAAVFLDVTAAVQLERCPGLEASVKPREEVAADSGHVDPARLRQRLYVTRCAALAAQLLAHTQQEPQLLLQLPLLGHPPAEVASSLLAAFARLVAGVAGLDAARGSQTVVVAAEVAARLDAAQQAAVAANSVLHLLDEDQAHKALMALDASLSRSPGPLLTQCAEVLLAGCSPRPLCMSVVCLVATLTSRRHTATRLLRYETTENEHLVGSTGREVGAGLCAALIALLPDDASSATSSSTNPDPEYHLHRHHAVGGAVAGPQAPLPLSPHAHVRASTASVRASSPHPLLPPGAPPSGSGQDPQAPAPGPGTAAHPKPGPDLKSDHLCVVVALRNLLAYSNGAKEVALRAGYHRVLLHSCSRAAAALSAAATVRAQPVVAEGRAGDRAPPAQGNAGASGSGTPQKPNAIARGPRRGAPAFGGRAARQPTAASDPRNQAGLRRAPVGAAVVVASEEQVGAAPDPEQVADPGEDVRHPAVASTPPRAPGPVGAPAAVDPRAAVRLAVEQKLVASLSLLKHLVYGSAPARQQLVQDGAVAVIRALWPSAASATSGPLFHELLGCLTNMLPECTEARARVCQEGAGPVTVASGAGETVLGLVLASLFGPHRLEAPTFSLVVSVLLLLTAAEDGAQLLLKSPFLGLCQKTLQDMASGAGSSHRGARDRGRQSALLQVLANLAAWPDGQRALLRASSGPGLMELVVRLVSEGTDGAAAPPPQATSAFATAVGAGAHNPTLAHKERQQRQAVGVRNTVLELVRNLCFAAEAKAHLLAYPAVLPALVAAVEAVADNPQGAAYAASGLWALSYHGEKVKAALRRVPSAMQRLVTANATCRFREDRARAAEHDDNSAARDWDRDRAGQQGQGPAWGPGGDDLGRPGGPTAPDWLQLAASQLAGLLSAMQATTVPGPGDAPVKGTPGWAAGAAPPHAGLVAPDWSPQRDQGGLSAVPR